VTEQASPREELHRLARAARLLMTLEREGGVLDAVGTPAPAPPARAEAPSRSPSGPSGRPSPPLPTPAPAPDPVRRPPRPVRPFTPHVRPLDQPADALAPFGDLVGRVSECTRCGLCQGRTLAVFGEGNARADVVFCGEGPGYEEDRSGRPFVGKAGELLTRMIENGMKLRREEVFILNAVKCRPPGNRTPTPDEVGACLPYLEEQLAVIGPKVIVALGNPAVHALLGPVGGITRVRGRTFDKFGAKVVPTFHPAYLLRNPAGKRDAWEDLKLVMRLLAAND
jgi:uracil-DNA glycosylase